jgi:hypothetical protein
LKLKRFIVPGVVAGLIASALTMPIGADDGVITTTVTPLVLSVSVNQTSIDYGSVPLSADDNSRSVKQSPAIQFTNNGSVPSKLLIRGSDATTTASGHSTWILDCDPSARGEVGLNKYAHRFDRPSGTTYDFVGGGEALCSSPAESKELMPTLGAGDSDEFKLEWNMPTASTGYSPRSSTVTVIAVSP